MPSTRIRGISNHEMLFAFESFVALMRKHGYGEYEAQRASLYAVYRLGGMTSEQAWKDTDEVFPK